MYLACVDNPPGASKEGRPSLDSSLVKKVTQFYERDDNSRMFPGKRDTVPVVINGRKKAVHERHLYVTLNELHQLFMDEYPYVSINHSKFAFLQPSHVSLNNQMPNRVCLCRYHENFIMLLEALCKVHPDIPSDSSQFVKSLLCAQPLLFKVEESSTSKQALQKLKMQMLCFVLHHYIRQKQLHIANISFSLNAGKVL